jgi:hypothetical protein
LERHFGLIEGDAETPYRKLLEVVPFSETDRRHWVAFLAALTFPLSGAEVGLWMGAGSLALVSGAYALSAWQREMPRILYPSGLAAAIGLGMAGPTLLHSLPDPNYGLLYLPFAAAVAAIGYAVRARGGSRYAEPLLRVAFLASLFCLALQPAEAGSGTKQATAAGILAGLALLYAAASCLEGADARRVAVLTCLACGSLAGALLVAPMPAPRRR